MNILKKITKLFSAPAPKAPSEKKEWQIGKPWCTPYKQTGRVLWNAEKGTYVKRLHGVLA